MEFSLGDKVSLIMPMPYLKTADFMPMLRPPDLVSPDDIGVVSAFRGAENVEVRFRNGIFLIPRDRLIKSASR